MIAPYTFVGVMESSDGVIAAIANAIKERSDFVFLIVCGMVFFYFVLKTIDLPNFLKLRSEQMQRMLEIEGQKVETERERNKVQADYNAIMKEQLMVSREENRARHQELLELIGALRPILDRSASAIRAVENFDERLTVLEQEVRNFRLVGKP